MQYRQDNSPLDAQYRQGNSPLEAQQYGHGNSPLEVQYHPGKSIPVRLRQVCYGLVEGGLAIILLLLVGGDDELLPETVCNERFLEVAKEVLHGPADHVNVDVTQVREAFPTQELFL